MLKISARNCTVKVSEMRLMELSLKTEKSRFSSPGPGMILRPALPRRLKHTGNGSVVRFGPYTPESRSAFPLPKGHIGGRRKRETLCLNVVVGVPRIDKRRAPRATQTIRKCVIVSVGDSLRVRARPPSCGKRRAVARLKRSSQQPPVHYPRRRPRDRFSNRKLPGGTNNQI